MPLVERASKGSSEYRIGVGEGLKRQVFEALRLCIEGFLNHGPNKLDPHNELPTCRQNSFTLLYRLLFIMYAEDRGLLPYGTNKAYTENRSLRHHRDDIVEVLNKVRLHGAQADYPEDSITIWEDLQGLFDLIDRGHASYGVPAYNGGLFDPDAHPFLISKAIPNRHMARVIDWLGRTKDKDHPHSGLSRVDYRDLSIQHLGTIYEGLLELHPHYASEKMVVIRREGHDEGEEHTQPANNNVPRGFEIVTEYKPGEVYLLNNKGERRASGSYYTPNHIVDYIVEKTLGPLCKQINEKLYHEIDQAEQTIKGTRNRRRQTIQDNLDKLLADFDDRILTLRILDPAMGSGHFLLRVCQYLAEEVATNPHTGDPDADQLASGESTLLFWKRRIVEHCIYGVDLNPVAVELAKLALWLETASTHQPLTFLDHHLRCGNSLVGANIEVMGGLPDERNIGRGIQGLQVMARLPIMLKALTDIAAIPSETVEKIKEKEKLYRKVFEPTRGPLIMASHVWCSRLFLPSAQAVTANQYQTLLNTLDRPRDLIALSNEDWFKRCLAAVQSDSVNGFHWQLEFPEIFFDSTDLREGGGFDAIVGNPPYDVLSDKETGHDLSAFKSFLSSQDIYAPSFRGKNNLYKLFVCKAVDLLNDGGRLGFITPMAILGDDQAVEIRKRIFEIGAFTSIDAFPQKDDHRRRVFEEAKLSSAIFTIVKTADSNAKRQPFVSRVHPAQFIREDSPSLRLSSEQIPLYDPENLTIVSGSQEDWDLAVRIVASGRMGRLRQIAEFFQGEINETNETEKGTIKPDPNVGPKILRAAGVCLYAVREPSQNRTGDFYVDKRAFLHGKAEPGKAYAFREARIGVQGNAPQNNFRRLIAAIIPAGTFCFYTINYAPKSKVKVPLECLLALLNSKIADWYFSLGSTSAHANQYQLYNLPCPIFREQQTTEDSKAFKASMKALNPLDPEAVLFALRPLMIKPPYGTAVRDIIMEIVKRIIVLEKNRGDITRTERSALDPAAQPYQDLIDRIFYMLAGLSDSEWQNLEKRLTGML
ncbi:MAG: Eco57I restriction-modification methylase domain-containing protein [Planctomycetes bacterium]|nr:Eco57I restriction-modification methylase domain-containing protein [Planctomycetota bacterium]